jgi:hypothetical protein
MSTAIKTMDETRLAEEIVRVLPEGAIRICCSDRDAVRYAVRSRELKLRTIVLGRHALRRLLHDRDGVVKIEYLQRDLLRSAETRCEFTYPRPRVAPRQDVPADVTLPRLVATAR